jgi:Na+-transporting NADH:ubiquinone oxidoreductase subunit F
MILKSLIFINGFALFIGFLILFLDTVISRYGPVTITLNGEKEFRAEGGKSLLRVLFENKYFVPSACGGKGTCGYCKLVVNEGGGEALPTESLVLTPREIRQGYRMSCQLKVRNDMSIYIPPEYLEIKEYTGEIASSELVTSDIRKIRIKLIDPESISFKPGQYVQIRFDAGGDYDYRAYSVASHPDEQNEIELNVKLIPEGLGSTYLHSLKQGDAVYFSGPYGDFFLNTESNRKIVCCAGGVGLAPLKAIAHYWLAHSPDREIEFYYGSRTTKDLYDHEVFRELAEKSPNFKYYPALSDEDPDWDGDNGFIHTIIDKHLEGGEKAEAYLCGPPIMIDAVTDVLLSKGVTEERILYDKF